VHGPREEYNLSMTYGHLTILLKELSFSPEQLGERLGIAGRTIRRWTELPQADELPSLYSKALRETILEFVAEGKLSTETEVVGLVLKEGNDSFFHAAIRDLGMGEDFFSKADQSPDSIVEGIAQIGSNEKKRASVDRSKEKISTYQKLGREWKYRVQTLSKAIMSKDLTRFEKFAAYGALFYLISPFDLIPDHIPVFGLMDDYVILGLTVAYYLKRFPKIFADNAGNRK
jgi:uncharacterized membrane protein YkvA (DUF1232 family)